MNRILIVVATLSLTFPIAGTSQSITQTVGVTRSISTHELHSLMQSAQ
jgi:hypothetical protein